MILMENGGGMANSDLRNLIETRIPEHRAVLENSHANLENVATYCEQTYMNAADKKAAFEETKHFALQSLASVAYQINTLARDLLDMLELQTDKIDRMASQVEAVDVVVGIHKEKIARREIGSLTTNKSIPKQPKIVTPAVQEPTTRYKRTPIDYTVLDGVGHGARPVEQPVARTMQISRAPSTVSGAQNYGAYGQYERTANINNTLGRASLRSGLNYSAMGTATPSEHYRIPQVMPLLDDTRFSSSAQSSSSGDQFQYGANMPMTSTPTSHANFGGSDYGSSIGGMDRFGTLRATRTNGPPSPAMPMGTMQTDRSELPPPPLSLLSSMHEDMPLPPPPMTMQQSFFDTQADWIPKDKEYIEKAVAIYDYDADKPDELSLRENCVVYILRKNDDGWFEGVLDGVTGLFPGNYVQPI